MLAGCSTGPLATNRAAPEPLVSPEKREAAQPPFPRTVNRMGLAFRRLPAGEFTRGTDDGARVGEFAACEQPRHLVRLTKPFWMSECEVTRGQFQRFVVETGYRTEAERSGEGVNGLDVKTGAVVRRAEQTWLSPGFAQTDQHPVVAVSDDDAQQFCRWLSQQDGRTYRLPTEAEWEYACRAGTDTAFASGETFSPQLGNVGDAALRAVFAQGSDLAAWSDQYPFTAPVGSFQPNRFGLFDMHGNVGEWCQDWFAPYGAASPQVDPRGPNEPTAWRVVRGGSWYNSPEHCRSAGRHDGLPTAPSTTNGFRVVMEAEVTNDE
jgi:formylglycine-generating enzyme required for sulfatase activity